ncbi:MAG: F0F1 ATP synthase subunit A [Planctomycetaceae bacterium]|jgi:F-type H+-transporting ATPase subunit a|nr:F0F1 ATP synthase subunit A [Planctomycetaceae bacterium]
MSDPASHAQDATYFHLPEFLGGEIELPKIPLGFYDFQITKYMVIEIFVAVCLVAVFVPLAKRIVTGQPPRGRFWNLFEVFLLYIRDQVVRPCIDGTGSHTTGSHAGHKRESDKYLPFLWTLFFFILFCNLFGMLPWMGSPTGSIAVTGLLAVIAFLTVTITGIKAHGGVGYWLGLVPKMDLPFGLGYILKPMLFVIEIVAYLIKHGVLAIRLWANMFAGHVVLAVFLGFIGAAMTLPLLLCGTVTGLSLFMSVALSFLELFVAFLQAYIFVFLTSLFIGGAIHQH